MLNSLVCRIVQDFCKLSDIIIYTHRIRHFSKFNQSKPDTLMLVTICMCIQKLCCSVSSLFVVATELINCVDSVFHEDESQVLIMTKLP